MPAINPFSNVQLAISGSTVTIQYSVSSDFAGPTPYTFEVQAYEDNSLTEPLYTISSTSFFATDDHNLRQNVRPSFLYRVKLTTHATLSVPSAVYYSNFIGWHPSNHVDQHKYLLANEISRREHIRFNYVGLPVYLLKRKSYSAGVASDVDPVTGEPVFDNTSTYGVGMAGGYYTPTICRLSIESRVTKENYKEDGNGVQRIEILSTRSVGFPFIEQHDILVFPDGKRFIVTDPGNKYFPGTTLILLQMSTMQLVPITDTVYNITIPAFPNES